MKCFSCEEPGTDWIPLRMSIDDKGVLTLSGKPGERYVHIDHAGEEQMRLCKRCLVAVFNIQAGHNLAGLTAERTGKVSMIRLDIGEVYEFVCIPKKVAREIIAEKEMQIIHQIDRISRGLPE